MNCEVLTDDHIAWADLVLFSAMMMQHTKLFVAADRCRAAGKPVVFGGPYPTSFPDECRSHCDYMVLNEGEVTWPLFLADLQADTLQPVYASEQKPDITQSPCPRFDLVDMANYATIPLQYSRGCPFQCEFCDITVLYGRAPRTKTPTQMLAELDALYRTGYRGGVFIVDDNFIGNKREVKKFLPELERWNREHKSPFEYGTEASLNLAEDPKLLKSMIEAGFLWIFIGIETPSTEALKETRKLQNVNSGATLLERVRVLQTAGLLIFGGFILGFDNETDDIFDRQIEFITAAAIPNAMVGQLGALPNTPLLTRMQAEGRLLHSLTDDQGFGPFYSNFKTKLPYERIVRGQRRILETIYQPRTYFDRLAEAYRRLPRETNRLRRIKRLLFPSGMVLGSGMGTAAKGLPQMSARARLSTLVRFLSRVDQPFRREALRFSIKMLRKRPEYLQQSLDYLVAGYHYYSFTKQTALPQLDHLLEAIELRPEFREACQSARHQPTDLITIGVS